VGGPVLLGFISAVAFATILAVVAGLTLAGASAVSHDIYGQVIARGQASDRREILISKISAIVIGIIAVLLAYAFEKQNVAFMAGLALSVAASCNFPVLTMAIFWRGMTTRGAVAGGLVGLFASVVLVVLSKTVWVAVFHFATAPFPYENPALFSMPLAFLSAWLFSVTDRSARAARERAAFEAQFVQSEIGIALATSDRAVPAATA
jgi:cation/acetate symporter